MWIYLRGTWLRFRAQPRNRISRYISRDYTDARKLKDSIGRAHKIASELEAEGFSTTEASTILAMALGILAEGDERGHRNLRPLANGMLKAAQLAFDALRDGRNREPGHA